MSYGTVGVIYDVTHMKSSLPVYSMVRYKIYLVFTIIFSKLISNPRTRAKSMSIDIWKLFFPNSGRSLKRYTSSA